MSWEGGNVGVVPGTACGGVQNRPPGTESPSRLSVTLLVLFGGAVFPGCWCCVLLILFCLVVGLGVLSVISSGYLSVPRIPQFLGFSHTLRDVFTLP